MRGQKIHFENYTINDGLALNQVLCSYQDKKGYMWFGTNGAGLSRFDGVEFTSYRIDQGLANNTVYSIWCDDDGLLYCATNGGLSIFDGFQFKNYTKEQGLKSNRVFNVFRDSKKQIWLNTMKGPHLFNNGKIVPFNKDSLISNSRIFVMEEDKDQNLWFGSIRSGLIKWDGKEKTIYNSRSGLATDFIRGLHTDDAGILWVGTVKGLHIIKDGKLRRIMSGTTITSIIRSRIGQTWISSEQGIFVYEGLQLVRTVNIHNGLPEQKLWGVFSDREGNMWCGSDNSGVIKITFPFDLFLHYEFGLDEGVKSIYRDSEGNMWFGAKEWLIKLDRNKKTTRYPLPDEHFAHAIVEDAKGKIWVGLEGPLTPLMYLDQAADRIVEYKPYTDWKIFPRNSVLTLRCDEDGTIWGGNYSGLFTLNKNKLKHVFKEYDDGVWSILKRSNGDIWLGLEQGLAKINQGKLIRFQKNDGAVDDRVTQLVEDNLGNLWFGTNQGLYVYQDHEFNRISKKNGIRNNSIFSIIIDENHKLWMGTNEGIGSLEIDAYIKNDTIIYNHYGKSHGFTGVKCHSGAVLLDNKKRLWYGTVGGATLFNKSRETTNMRESTTIITDILIHNEKANWNELAKGIDSTSGLPIGLTLESNNNYVLFKYTGISLTNPSEVRYKHRLLPIETNWNPETEKRETNYTNLPPNEYTFEIISKNNDELWNQNPTTINFTVLPPFYRTWWFYGLCCAIVAALVYSYISVRMINAKIKKQQIELANKNKQLNRSYEEIEYQKVVLEQRGQEILDSINYAKRIQTAILPPANLINQHLPDNFVLYVPKDIVAGDFYWMEVKNEKVYFSAADCTGHGVPGAMVSVMCSNALSQATIDLNIEKPARILDKTVELLEERFSKSEEQMKDGMDLALCSWNSKTNILEYAGANNPLWIIRAGTDIIVEIKADKQPIGAYDKRTPYTNHEIQLYKNDIIYIFSDGYVDQFGGPRGKKFMFKNFRQILLDSKDKPMLEQKVALYDAFTSWRGDGEQIDDICMIGFKV